MFFKKSDKDDQPPPPPWLTWGVLAFIGLAIIMNVLGIKPEQTAPQPQLIKSHINPSPSGNINWGMFDIDTYKARLMPGYGKLQIVDSKVGDGNMAVCGQDVTIKYHVIESADQSSALAKKPVVATETVEYDEQAETNAEPADPKEPEDKELSFRLGDKNAAPQGLQSGVLGMRKGGTREVVVPAERSEDGQTVVSYGITLVDASPEYADDYDSTKMPLRTFEKRVGIASSVLCGDKVRLHVTLWDLSGTRLFSTYLGGNNKPIEFTLGSGELMLGIELGLLEMQADSARTLLIPPYLQAPLRPNAKKAESPVAEQDAAEQNDEDKTEESALDESIVQSAEVMQGVTLPENQAILADIELVP
jgi:FKBP-type peptidyl-prolyl cis-trans isomerase 2